MLLKGERLDLLCHGERSEDVKVLDKTGLFVKNLGQNWSFCQKSWTKLVFFFPTDILSNFLDKTDLSCESNGQNWSKKKKKGQN